MFKTFYLDFFINNGKNVTCDVFIIGAYAIMRAMCTHRREKKKKKKKNERESPFE